MKVEKMWEVFQSARNGSEKYLLCEGTPDDFYDREIMYLTATVLQQNLETKLPHLVLFHDGTNDLEMKVLDELRPVSHPALCGTPYIGYGPLDTAQLRVL